MSESSSQVPVETTAAEARSGSGGLEPPPSASETDTESGDRLTEPASLAARLSLWFSRPEVLIGVLVNLGLLVLPFMNPYDNGVWIRWSSYFTNGAPVLSTIRWPGGMFSVSVFVPTYLAYVWSGFSVYWAVAVLKLILFAFTVGVAVFLEKIASQVSPANARRVVAFTLLNPAILFVNYVWVEPDIVTLFLVLVTYYALRFRPGTLDSPWKTAAGLVPLMIAAFYYYYPLVLIPVLFIYTPKGAKKLNFALVALIIAAAFFALQFYAFKGPYDYVSALNSGVVGAKHIQGLQAYLPQSLIGYLAVLVLIGVAVPWILKESFNFRESTAAGFVLLAFLYTSVATYPDNFLWVFPFLMISLLLASEKRIRISWFLLSNLFAITGIVAENFIAGFGHTFGIFYWGYELFHTRFIFIWTGAQYMRFIIGYNSALLGALVAVLAFFWLLELPRKRLSQRELTEQDALTLGNSSPVPAPSMRGGRRAAGNLAIAVILLVVVLVPVSLVFNADFGDLIDDHAVRSAPLELLWPGILPNYQWTMPDPYYTYFPNGNTITFEPISPPLVIDRNLSNQAITMGGQASIALPSNESGIFEFLNSSLFFASFAQGHVMNIAGASAAVPVQSTGVTPANATYLSFFNQSVPTFTMATLAYNEYRLNATALNESAVVGFRLTRNAPVQTVLLVVITPRYKVQVDVSLGVVEAAWQNTTTEQWHALPTISYANATASGWNYLQFSARGGEFNISINGLSQALGAIPLTPGADLYLGNPFGNAGYTFPGAITKLYLAPSLPSREVASLLVATRSGPLVVQNLTSLATAFSYSYQNSTTTFATPGGTETFVGREWFVDFGKVTPGNYSVSISVSSMAIHQSGPSGFFLVPVLWCVVAPYAVAVASCYYFLRPRTL